MRTLDGKTIEHVDGRKGHCFCSRPKNGLIDVFVDGKREKWGQQDVVMESFIKALGLNPPGPGKGRG